MNQPKAVDINVILDRSGSMQSIAADTIGGFNTFLAQQVALPGQATISLYQFDNVYEIVYAGKDIRHAPMLSAATFVPRGATALLDAIGRTINEVSQRRAVWANENTSTVVVVISTDGYENASREFSAATIKTMIDRKRAQGWEFVFLGANQDAITKAAQFGIPAHSAMNVAANSVGTQAMYGATGQALGNLRSGVAVNMAYTAEDREVQANAGAMPHGAADGMDPLARGGVKGSTAST